MLISALPLNGLCDLGQIPFPVCEMGLHQVISPGSSSSGILWFSDSDQGQSRPLPLGGRNAGSGIGSIPRDSPSAAITTSREGLPEQRSLKEWGFGPLVTDFLAIVRKNDTEYTPYSHNSLKKV